MRHTRILMVVLLTLAAGCATARRKPAPAAAASSPTDLPFGDPARRARRAPLVLDGITDTAAGKLMTSGELAAKLAGVDVLLVGEMHTSPGSHEVQRRVIEALHAAGRHVTVALEMLPSDANDALARWTSGTMDDETFLRTSRWYERWGFPFGLYRDVLVAARERGLRVIGANVPQEIITTVRRKGFTGLTPAQRGELPEKIDTTNEEHRRYFRALFDPADAMHAAMPPEMWEGIFRAQCTWDAAMAHKVVQAARAAPSGQGIVVMLVGSGHVAYGLGISRQARLFYPGKIATLIPLPLIDDEGKPTLVRASYAEFVWGLPPDPALSDHPTLGVSLSPDGATVKAVQPGSSAARAGLLAGDRLQSVDGRTLAGKGDLAFALHGKQWGDGVQVELTRGGRKLTLNVPLRRTMPAP